MKESPSGHMQSGLALPQPPGTSGRDLPEPPRKSLFWACCCGAVARRQPVWVMEGNTWPLRELHTRAGPACPEGQARQPGQLAGEVGALACLSPVTPLTLPCSLGSRQKEGPGRTWLCGGEEGGGPGGLSPPPLLFDSVPLFPFQSGGKSSERAGEVTAGALLDTGGAV